MNIEFAYMYRDGGNNKNGGSVVFANPDGLSLTDLADRLAKAFDQQEYFIASQVGIPDVFLWGADADYDPEDSSTYPAEGFGPGRYVICEEMDHCWHEFAGVDETEAEPTDTRSITQFVEAVERASGEGWKQFEPKKKVEVAI